MKHHMIPRSQYAEFERKALAQGQVALTRMCERIREIDPRAGISFHNGEVLIECTEDKCAAIQTVFDEMLQNVIE